MQRLKRKQSCSTIAAMLAVTMGLSSFAYADIQQPIYPVPANTGNSCMADAYVAAGGSGMKNKLGESLNCTANDVEITQVIPTAIILPDGSASTDLTCTLGEPFKLRADIKVRSNAAERWDTTFYVPRKEGVDPDVIIMDNEACSIVLPVPVGTAGFDSAYLVAQQRDSDVCGDIKKSELINDEYTLIDAEFEIICEDDGLDGMADFNYCAAWDNIERQNCSADVGQVPNNKSKCKCDNFNIDVFIQPNPPTVVKTLLSSDNAPEPMGTFKYQLTITKATGADVDITNIDDIYRSSTDSSVFANFNLNGTSSDTQVGNLTLLATLDDHTCDNLGLPITLTDTIPSLSCIFFVKINDENLPDDATPNDAISPDELYEDFIRFSATDSEGRNVDIGNDNCDVTDADTSNNTGNCSNVITVKMTNVDPAVTITKTPISGPGLRQVPPGSGPYFVDDQGNITYELVITNISSVDDVWLTALIDDNGTADTADDINLLADSSGTPACSNAPTTSGSALSNSGSGAIFICQYIMDVTVAEGAGYTNKANVTVTENEARLASAMAMATITRASPMLTLMKDVAESVNTTDPNPALDSAAFMDSISIDEPGDTVVYRFTITNANTATLEALTLTSLTDDVLFANTRATKAASQRSDECSFTTVVNFGTPYVCTIIAEITGDATNVADTPYDDTLLVNTAYVSATAPNGSSVDSNTDTATVTFDPVPPTVASEFALQATVFLRIKNTSTFEDITLNQLKILGTTIADNTTIGNFTIRNLGATFFDGSAVDPCPEPDPSTGYATILTVKDTSNDTLECAFTVELSGDYNPNDFAAFTADATDGSALFIRFVDNEGSPADADAEARVQTNLP